METEYLHAGGHGDYRWISAAWDVHLPDLLRAFPELVLDKFVAITSRDSGSLPVTPELEAKGWQTSGGIASGWVKEPEVLAMLLELLGTCCSGYDEWWVFAEPHDLGELHQDDFFADPPRPGRVKAWVNVLAFALHEDDIIREMFWQQMEWIKPLAYLGEGRDSLNFATTDGALFEQVLDYLPNLS